MDYSRFQFRATVDWIKIAIETKVSTNFATIRRHGGFSYVEPIEPNDGGGTTRFLCTIQDPGSVVAITDAIAHLEVVFPLASAPTINAIEISLDAYRKAAGHAELAELAAYFFKYLTRPVSTNRRLEGRFIGDVEPVTGLGYARLRRKVAEGRVIAIGSQRGDPWGRWNADPVSQRIYLKTTDKGGDVHLPERLHRARIEITLQGEAVPMKSLGESCAFRFTSLSEWFSFRTMKDGLHGLMALVTERSEQVGERKLRWRVNKARTAYSGQQHYSSNTRADKLLNDRAKGALRRLTDSWSRGCPLADIRDTKTTTHPANTVQAQGNSINYTEQSISDPLPSNDPKPSKGKALTVDRHEQ